MQIFQKMQGHFAVDIWKFENTRFDFSIPGHLGIWIVKSHFRNLELELLQIWNASPGPGYLHDTGHADPREIFPVPESRTTPNPPADPTPPTRATPTVESRHEQRQQLSPDLIPLRVYPNAGLLENEGKDGEVSSEDGKDERNPSLRTYAFTVSAGGFRPQKWISIHERAGEGGMVRLAPGAWHRVQKLTF